MISIEVKHTAVGRSIYKNITGNPRDTNFPWIIKLEVVSISWNIIVELPNNQLVQRIEGVT